MISSSEKDTSLKAEAPRAWDQKSELWNVVGQRTVWVGILESFVFQLNSQCEKRGKDKGNLKLY